MRREIAKLCLHSSLRGALATKQSILSLCRAMESSLTLAMTVEPLNRTTSGEMKLPQQHRVRAVHRLGAVDHRALQCAGLHRDVLGKEPRQRDVALRIAAA